MTFGGKGARSAWTRPIQLIALGVLLCSCGCTSVHDYVRNGFKVGPNYAPPRPNAASQWIDQEDERLASVPADYHMWWTTFRDPTLDVLIEQARRQNLSLRAAGARVLQARAQRAVTVGNLLPQTQEAVADYTHMQQSRQIVAFGPSTISVWQLGGNLAWELDFWGRYRRAIESADATLEANIYDCNDVYVILLSEVAGTYVELRTLEMRLKYARTNEERLAESFRIAGVRRRFEAKNSEIDKPQALSNLERIRAAIPDLQILHRQANNRLAFLLGMPPGGLAGVIGRTEQIPLAPSSVAVGMPRDLVRRRPDVRRAERQLAAQCAQIGVAESDLLPHLTIRGTLGLSASQASNLFQFDSFGGNIGPSLRWDILNYGRLKNRVTEQEARFQELLAQYCETVLAANREAEDAAIAFLRSHDKIKYLKGSVKSAVEAERIATVQYKEGGIDFNRLASLQEVLVARQDDLATAQGDQSQAFIALIKALGGGWEPPRQVLPAPDADTAQPTTSNQPRPVPLPRAESVQARVHGER